MRWLLHDVCQKLQGRPLKPFRGSKGKLRGDMNGDPCAKGHLECPRNYLSYAYVNVSIYLVNWNYAKGNVVFRKIRRKCLLYASEKYLSFPCIVGLRRQG